MHGNKFGVAFGRTARGGAVKINSDTIRTHFHIQIYERVRAVSLTGMARPPPHHRYNSAAPRYNNATPCYTGATPLLRNATRELRYCYGTATPRYTIATKPLRRRCHKTPRTPTAHLYRHHFDGQFKNFTPVLPNINLHYTALTNSTFSANSTPVSGKK